MGILSRVIIGLPFELHDFPLLRQPDANIHERCAEANTPLHYACKVRKARSVSALIRMGAAVNAVNSAGQTPMDCAQVERDTTIISGMSPAFQTLRWMLGCPANVLHQYNGDRNECIDILRAAGGLPACQLTQKEADDDQKTIFSDD